MSGAFFFRYGPWFVSCLVSTLILVCPAALGRFQISDADQIDNDGDIGVEGIIDQTSYRYPVPMEDIWQESRIGYRVSAGSYNQTRFDFNEQIKIATDPDEPVVLSFDEDRREDLVEMKTLRQVELIFPHKSGYFFSIMGDGGTRKEYGDLGAGIGYGNSSDGIFKITYWSVDHFYNEKREFKDDRMDQNTYTLKLDGSIRMKQFLRLDFGYEFDRPLRWRRLSQGYVYHYGMSVLSLRLAYDMTPSESFYFSGFHEWKSERKEWAVSLKPEQMKSLARRVDRNEAGVIIRNAGTVSSIGAGFLKRAAYYGQSQLSDPSLYVESPSPGHIFREEPYIVATRFFPSYEKQFWQLGFYLDRVHMQDGERRVSWQSKLQSGWIYEIIDNAHVFLNMTWNLDDIVQDFPFVDKKVYHPWGGGNLQLSACF
ncbi:MAG: hypothetical protein HQK54_16350 [Oligoflexales bacterium]|nr:hypothetical protein [Oligoflexales bacterium]